MKYETNNDEKPLAYYLFLAGSLPKIARDDERVLRHISTGDQSYVVERSHGHFYLLWLSLQPGYDETSPVYRMYAERAIQHPRWADFEYANPDFAIRFAEAATYWNDLQELKGAVKLRLKQHRWEEADVIDAAVGHPLGIDAIDQYVWDILDPLLDDAAERLLQAGIDPSEFTQNMLSDT